MSIVELSENSDKVITVTSSIPALFIDKPLRIKHTNKERDFKYDSIFVEFKVRPDGTKPDNCWIRYDEAKKHYPNLVFEFYERNYLK